MSGAVFGRRRDMVAPSEKTKTHLLFLDGWRGAAILLVLIGHFWLDRYLPGVSSLGVELFFVLSGRLMAEILFVRQAPLGRFFLRRFSRVYPALLVYVLVVTLLFWSTPLGHGILAVLVSLTFTINYAMIYTHPVALLDHIWSLSVEEHSYVLLAIVAFWLRRSRLPAWPAILSIGLLALGNGVYRLDMLQQDYLDVTWRSDVHLAPIFLAAAFHLMIDRYRIAIAPWVAPLALALALAIFSGFSGGPGLMVFGAQSILLAVAVNGLDSSFASFRAVLSNRLLAQIGLWSFSLYLWQQPFYKIARDGSAGVPEAVLVGAVVGAALLSFYLIERPFRTWINESGISKRWVAVK